MTRSSGRRRARRLPDDAGSTLMELMIGMAVMSIFMTIFTAAVVNIYSSTNKVQAVENSSAQLNTAFDRLDKQVRYAVAIDARQAPTVATPYWSVAFELTDTVPPTCWQLAVGTIPPSTEARMAERSWTLTVAGDGSAVASVPSGWSQLAAGVTLVAADGTAITPFTVSTAPGATIQQLKLSLDALDGAGQAATRSSSVITFSALNSAATAAAPVCNQPGM